MSVLTGAPAPLVLRRVPHISAVILEPPPDRRLCPLPLPRSTPEHVQGRGGAQGGQIAASLQFHATSPSPRIQQATQNEKGPQQRINAAREGESLSTPGWHVVQILSEQKAQV